MCMHSALCSNPIDLIYNMTTFRKKVLSFDPTPAYEGARKDRIGLSSGPVLRHLTESSITTTEINL